MGNKQSKFQKLPSFPQENWHQISNPKARIKSDHGTYRVLRNNLTDQEVQEYLLTIHGLKQLQEFLQLCQWREREDSIVNTKFLSNHQDRQCCNDQYKAKLYIEHIPVRLSDIQDIPYPEYLYLLLTSLQGFEQLYQIIGYFRISEDFICMDKQGRVKVWLNSDLSKCYPLNTNLLDDAVNRQKTQALEGQMITQIMGVIEANTIDQDSTQTNVFEYIRQGCNTWDLTFRLAKQKLRNYAKKQKTQIPRFFQSVIGIFDDQPTPEIQEKINYENPRLQSIVDPYQPNKMYQNYESQVRPTYVKSQRQLRVYSQADVMAQEGEWAQNKILNKVPLDDEFVYESGVRSPVQKITQIDQQPIFLHIPKASTNIKKLPQSTKTGSLKKFPKGINFNYQGQTSKLNPIYMPSTLTKKTQPMIVVPPHFGKNLQSQLQFDTKNIISATTITGRPMVHPNITNMNQNGKMIYSDSLSTYELDPELAEDIIRYRSMSIN